MSTLEVSNLNDGTTTVGTTYITNGSSKVWININQQSTQVIRDSFNVSSLTDNAVADSSIAYTSSFNYAYNYSVTGHVAYYANQKFYSFRGLGSTNKLAGQIDLRNGWVSSTGGDLSSEDAGDLNLIMQGDLA